MNENENLLVFPRKFVYFEKQKNDRLCGLHALNALMQGPFFDVGLLTEFALKLNEMERQIMGNNSNNENIDDDGNYNVQVLTEALKFYNVDLIPINTKKLISMLNSEVEAILFNSSTHWFTIRKISGVWFNLNSTNSLPGPEIISDFYLSAFIQGTVEAGYTNFLVRKMPELPSLNSDNYKNLCRIEKHLVSIDDILKAREMKNAKKQTKEKEENKDDKKFKAFQGEGVSFNDNHILDNNFNELDEETRKAIEMSLNDFMGDMEKRLKNEPSEEDQNCYQIIFQVEGQSFTRRFFPDDTIGDMIDFLKLKLKTPRYIEIFESMPKKIYSDVYLKVKDARLSKKQYLMGKII